jgi:hypothetical protein
MQRPDIGIEVILGLIKNKSESRYVDMDREACLRLKAVVIGGGAGAPVSI